MENRVTSLVGPRGCRIAAVLTLCTALAACGLHHRKGRYAGEVLAADPASHHPILVEQDEDALSLHVARGRSGLTQRQETDLRYFLRRYRASHENQLFVRAPSGGPNEVAVMDALDDVRRAFEQAGVLRREVDFDAYASDGGANAAIRIGFTRHRAVAPECGDWSENLGRDAENAPYPNLGCASQRNLAAMVADPGDLVRPRTMTARSSERRDVVWDKYVKGEVTAAEKAEAEKAQVSEVQGGGG